MLQPRIYQGDGHLSGKLKRLYWTFELFLSGPLGEKEINRLQVNETDK